MTAAASPSKRRRFVMVRAITVHAAAWRLLEGRRGAAGLSEGVDV